MSLMKKKLGCCLLLLFMASIVIAEVKVKDVSVKPRWPWNGLVDIIYSIECKEKDVNGDYKDVYVEFKSIDNDRGVEVTMKSLTGDGAKAPVKDGGPYTVTWDASKDVPTLNSSDLKVRIHAIVGGAPYLVVDLSGGSNAENYPVRYTSLPPNLDDDTCRTTELWFRQIPAGTFMMGSPSDEVGRINDYEMVPHKVTITQIFYIGVFECTQRQWELIMGNRPSYFSNATYYATRPVELVSYDNIRGSGSQAGAGWPIYGHKVDASSFMGKLQEKTGLTFDLPTEAQWEYACRAGTTTALNSGKNLTSTDSDTNMNEVGRYWFNGGSGYTNGYQNCIDTYGTAKVGSYLPNAWGLYDMHGNVTEWCLDWYGASLTSTTDETNPVGPNAGSARLLRGSGWSYEACRCRSADRDGSNPYYIGYRSDRGYGFRIACLP